MVVSGIGQGILGKSRHRMCTSICIMFSRTRSGMATTWPSRMWRLPHKARKDINFSSYRLSACCISKEAVHKPSPTQVLHTGTEAQKHAILRFGPACFLTYNELGQIQLRTEIYSTSSTPAYNLMACKPDNSTSHFRVQTLPFLGTFPEKWP